MKAIIFIFLTAFAIELVSSQRPPQVVARQESGKKVDLKKYRMDVDSKNYIEVGTTANCPENMRFFAVVENETAGICDCDYYQCSRPSIYSPEKKQCYFAWSQGPCAKGEWYTFNSQLIPVCEKRGCDQGANEGLVTSATVSLSYWFKSPKDGKCYESGTQGYCEEYESLLIMPGEPIPECRHTTVCVPLGQPAPQFCLPGNRKSYLGQC